MHGADHNRNALIQTRDGSSLSAYTRNISLPANTQSPHDAIFHGGSVVACAIRLRSRRSSNRPQILGCGNQHEVRDMLTRLRPTSHQPILSIRKYPGHRVLLNPTTALNSIFPEIKAITLGKNYFINNKHTRKFLFFAPHNHHPEPFGSFCKCRL